jgi:DNA-binding MarR family transcriptional regulator
MALIDRKRRRNSASHTMRVGMMLHQAASRWQRLANEALSEVGLNHTQYVILWGVHTMSTEGITPTQVELSAYTGTDVMLTSKSLRTLEELGLVVRVSHPTDTRARCISLSEQGLSTFHQAETLILDVEQRFFGNADPQTLRTDLVPLLSNTAP